MQINIDDRGALLLALFGVVAGAVVFAPDMVTGALDALAAAIQGVAG